MERSHTGAIDMSLLCWTLLASMLKYSDMVSMLPGRAALALRSGKTGAPMTTAARADATSTEARIVKADCVVGFDAGM